MKRDYSAWLNIVGGRRTDYVARMIRLGLGTLELVYRPIIGVRNWAYDANVFRIHDVAGTVISIGNLTAGGTGKTPFVMWLIEQLRDGPPIAVVSRGYGAVDGELNDEGREIQQWFPDVLQIQSPDRVSACQSAIEQLQSPADAKPLLILDDGFQHRRLRRNLDVVLIDATNPFGFDRLLPRGLLREPRAQLSRADVAVLTRSHLVSVAQRRAIQEAVLKHNDGLIWVESVLEHHGWHALSNAFDISPPNRDQRLLAFCGIGNPDSFMQSLAGQQLNIVARKVFPDHHPFDEPDLISIFDLARQQRCDAVVCTHKDLVKLNPRQTLPLPVFAMTTHVAITNGLEPLLAAVKQSYQY